MAFSESGPKPGAPSAGARALPKRFYTQVEMAEQDGRFLLRLDGKSAHTPARNLLAVQSRPLADAIAAEWSSQGEKIDPAAMPATRLANTALDGVATRMDEVRDSVRSYAGSDLLYYRAGEPEALVLRQNELWNPILAWAEQRFGVRFLLAEGVIHVAQQETALASVGSEIDRFDEPFRLTALHLATTLSGSALIALAVAAGALDAERAWAAAHVDEDWNIDQWGADAEAVQRRAHRHADFAAAALVLRAE